MTYNFAAAVIAVVVAAAIAATAAAVDHNNFRKNHISIPVNIVSKCGKEHPNEAIREAVQNGKAGKIEIRVKEGRCSFTFVQEEGSAPT